MIKIYPTTIYGFVEDKKYYKIDYDILDEYAVCYYLEKACLSFHCNENHTLYYGIKYIIDEEHWIFDY